MPAVIAAVFGRDPNALVSALADGHDVNDVDHDGRTALHHAVLNKDQEAVDTLLRAGAETNIGDREGWTPLHFAARDHQTTIAVSLMNAGALVDAVDVNGNTPLHRATFESRGRGDMITLLKGRGADPFRKNNHGVSAASLAETIANFDVKKWFQEDE